MLRQLTEGPLLWYVTRSTGVVLLVLLTASTAVGVLATARASSTAWPRFVTQGLHRNISVLTVVMMALHVISAVVHDFVDIRWYEAVIPFVGSFRPFWVGLGTVSVDLLIAVMATSWIRHRMNHRAWRVVHLLSYLGWAIGVAHGIGLGTDRATGWGIGVTVLSVGVVATFSVLRLATFAHERRLAA